MTEMDSRTIYESNKTYLRNVTWKKPKDSDSEWRYVETKDTIDNLTKIISDFFITERLCIAVGRQDSFETEKACITEKIQSLIGNMDFSVWDDPFQNVIEFNKIGVYRTGRNESR